MRIVFDPGGANELVILDWGQVCQVPDLSWAQAVQTDSLVSADWAVIFARGNVERTWTITARVKYSTAIEMIYEPLDHDADLPIGIKAQLYVRVLDMAEDPTASEAARTLKMYVAAAAVIESCTPKAVPEIMVVDYTYQIRLGALTPI